MTQAQTVVTVPELESIVENWINDAICRRLSARTIGSERDITGKLFWWLKENGIETVDSSTMRAFLAYVGSPAPEGGRWGNKHQTGTNSPRTVHTYWDRLRTMFNWAVAQEIISESPMKKIKPPVVRRDQIQPFTQQQIADLLEAARSTRNSLRDTAIVQFMLDTGVRASELCALKAQDLDLTSGKATVLGKGNKHRPVWISPEPLETLCQYLNEQPRRPADPVFCGESGSALTRSGLLQLIERLGKKAGLTGVRCSPHTLRHSASIWALRSGMNMYSLQSMLGHTDLTMTSRYVAIAEADLENQHRRFSPFRCMMTK